MSGSGGLANGSIQAIPTASLQHLFQQSEDRSRQPDNKNESDNSAKETPFAISLKDASKGPELKISKKIDAVFRLRPRLPTSLDELESDDELLRPRTVTPKPGEKKRPGRPKKELTLMDIFKVPKKRGRPRNDSLIDERHIVTGSRKQRGRPRKAMRPIVSVVEGASTITITESIEGTPTAEPRAFLETKAKMKPVMVEFEEKDILSRSSRRDFEPDSDDGKGYLSEDSARDWRPKYGVSSGIGLHGNRRGRPRIHPKIEKDINTVPRPRGRPRSANHIPKDPNLPPRPRGRPKKEKLLDDTVDKTLSPRRPGRPKKEKLLDDSIDKTLSPRRPGRPKKSPVKEEKPAGIVEFEYDDEVEDDLTKFVFVNDAEAKEPVVHRQKHSDIEKQRKLIQADVFESPKKQKLGSISLSNSPSPSKKGIPNLPGSSPTRLPNGRAGSPRKMNKQQLQDRSARKKATRVLYSKLMDDEYDEDDEDFEEEQKLAERIIKESKNPQSAAPSPFATPRRNNINLPTNDPNFVPTPLPTAAEEENFFDSKYADKALFLDGPEGYFDQHRTRVKTSNNSMVQAVPLEDDEFNSFVLLSGFLHHKEKEKLVKTYKEMYTQWYFELSQGFSLIFFGVGSKRRLLLDYVEEYLTQMVNVPTIVVNGYNPATVFKEILMTIVSILNLEKVPRRLSDLVNHIVEHFENKASSPKLILLVHNIDGPGLRDDKTQIYLSKLASVKQILVLASVDHINAPLLWDSVSLHNFNFLWHNTTTFSDYLTETSFQDLMSLGQTQKSAGSKGAKYVLSSLTANSRSLYRVLVSDQLQNMEDDQSSKKVHSDNQFKGTIKHALEYKKFFTLCAEEFISSNEINFRTMLMEFVEHKMAVLTKDQSGTEMVFIPFSLEELQKLLEDELL